MEADESILLIGVREEKKLDSREHKIRHGSYGIVTGDEMLGSLVAGGAG